MADRNSQSGLFSVLGGLLLLLVVAFVVLRKHDPVPVIPPPPVEAAVPSNTLDIEVYLDGSGSIQNFLKPPVQLADGSAAPVNYVKDLLDKTESTLHNAPGNGVWSDLKLHFWSFGAGQPKELASGGGLRRMGDDLKGFNQPNTKIETPIDFEPGGSDGADPRPELKIIFTDLYQSNGELERPADDLADKYLKGDTGAVGVIAIRSPFTGLVEDLPGAHGKTFPNAADSMPFYAIFGGLAGDVRHAMDTLVSGTSLNDAIRSGRATEFYFSRAAQAHADDLKMKFSPSGGYSTDTMNYKGSHIPLIRLSKGKLKVNWTDNQQDAAHAVQVGAGDQLVPTLQAVGAGGKLRDETAQAVEPCGDAELLCVEVDRSKLTKGTTYIVRIDRTQTKVANTLTPDADAMKKWDIEVPEAERISAMPSPVFPRVAGLGSRPGRTPDFSEFLMALQGQMFHAPVHVTSYYLYLQAN